MAKQIALKTQTALERSTASQKELKVREVHPHYLQDSEFELLDEYVSNVLEWQEMPPIVIIDDVPLWTYFQIRLSMNLW